jgi:peptidyl-prolyl cis-trans isomerase A (cyclophilin A)
MRPLLLFATIATLFANSLKAQEDGLFANFQTSMGMIRAQLEFEKAALTVSNFVGLIEGSQTALDLTNGKLIQGGYFDNLTFHRTIPDFVIQGGSPAGNGQDGPGYSFQDEFHPDLTHNEPFVLSMANSGLNTNGSQFFITVAATPWLNNVHSVFGKVVSGSEVATAASEVKTDQGSVPLTPIVIEKITIERVGAAAEAFQLDIAGLPQVGLRQPEWQISNNRYVLDVDFQKRSEYRVFSTSDLKTWTNQSLGFFGETVPTVGADVTDIVNNQPQGFFRFSEVLYPVVVFPPANVASKTLETFVTQINGSLNFTFTAGTMGTTKLGNNEPISFSNFLYRVDGPTRATLIVPSTHTIPFNLPQYTLNFASASTGTFVLNLPNAFPPGTIMSGTFTLNDS